MLLNLGIAGHEWNLLREDIEMMEEWSRFTAVTVGDV
jgi:hypothetical protein